MVRTATLYMDDSGTRHPDRNINLDSVAPDWFALGGIIVREEDEERCRRLIEKFCESWAISKPLHSEEIRNFKGAFGQFRQDPARQAQFFAALEEMLLALPVVGIACVIDRLGYHRRYHAQYGSQKWSLCRSAFAICVERAAKFARLEGRKLNVYVERSDKKTDQGVEAYFKGLRGVGHPFDGQTAAKYGPLGTGEFADVLYDFRLKTKSSQLMQAADLYLYPICRGGYPKPYRPFEVLRSANKLIDAHVESAAIHGIKYFCFEGVGK